MTPRNLIVFALPESWKRGWFEDREVNSGASFSIEKPEAIAWFAECALQPVGPLELSSQGFVPPLGQHDDRIAVRVGDCVWLTLGTEHKLLPASVLNAEMAKRLADIEQLEGRKAGGRVRKRVKDEVVAELLPRALVKPSRTDAWIDLNRGLMVVDTASRKRAEAVVSEVRRALGSFPALPVNCEVAPRAVLTGWLHAGGWVSCDGVADEHIHVVVGDAAHLADPTDSGGRVRIDAQDLGSEEIGHHLEAGKQVTRLRIIMDDAIEIDVGEDMVLRRLRLLDAAIDALDSQERDDMPAELSARFALASELVGRLLDALGAAFRWSKVEG